MSDEKKPKTSSSFAQRELDKVEKQFDEFDQNVKALTQDRMNEAPRVEVEQQTKISAKEMSKNADIYLKPVRSISSREKFNEEYRKDYMYQSELVYFIAENKELSGETIDTWTKPFPGMPAEEWKIPCNKPLWGPRHLAEQIKRCYYHRLVMRDQSTSVDGMGSYYGTLAADTTVQRLDAIPATKQKSVFMGSSSF
jgi:hypothetical protein